MSVHIHIVTPVIPTGLTLADDFIGILPAEDRVTYSEISYGPSSVESNFHEMLASPATVEEVISAARSGVDAVVIDCMSDPGLKAARECVDIPVLGPGETMMHLANVLGNKFSILTTVGSTRGQIDAQARAYGVIDRVASIRAIEFSVLELRDEPVDVESVLLNEAKEAIFTDGADTLVMGCTGMTAYVDRLRVKLDSSGVSIPILDPIPDTVRFAKMLLMAGLSHSKIAYPRPEKQRIDWHGDPPFKGFHS